MTGVDGARFDSNAQCALEICAGHHNERVAAAKLEHAFFDLVRGHARHCAPGFFATGKRYRFDAWIGDYLFHLFRLDQQRLENAVSESSAAKDFFNGKRALRDIGCVL